MTAMRQDMIGRILADLMRRVERLGDMRASLSSAALLDEIDEIAHLARRSGFHDVEGLAAMLATAVTLHGLGPILLSYLELMREAIMAHEETHSLPHFVPPPVVTLAAAWPLRA